MTGTYDIRTSSLLSPFNALLSRHYLPTIAHPNEITTSLVIALYESLIQTRLAAINRKDKSQASQIRNVKLLLGEMVMAGWDVGMIDPIGVVEREESCLMDMIEVLVEIGREKYGTLLSPPPKLSKKELSTIAEVSVTETSNSDSESSTSTLRPIHQRADAILSRLHTLNPSLRSPSPTESVISRGTQTSPPPPPQRTRHHGHHQTLRKRTPRRPTKREKAIQTNTEEDTDSGIPSSIPLSYSSDSSSGTIHIKSRSRSILSSPRILAPSTSHPVSRSRSSSSSSDPFRIDSPYTAVLRRRRQLALNNIRHRPKKRHIRVLSVGRDIPDSTFAEDSDSSATPRRRRVRSRTRREEGESTEGVTDLERRVEALRVWAGIEEERKEVLLGEIKRRRNLEGGRGGSWTWHGSESGRSGGLEYW